MSRRDVDIHTDDEFRLGHYLWQIRGVRMRSIRSDGFDGGAFGWIEVESRIYGLAECPAIKAISMIRDMGHGITTLGELING